MVVAGKLGIPRGVVVSTGVDGDLLHVADTVAYRVLHPLTEEVRDGSRAVATDLNFPAGVSAHRRNVRLTAETFARSGFFNLEGKMIREVSCLNMPAASIECEDGTIVVTEPPAGRVLRLSGDQEDVLAEGLQLPTGLAYAQRCVYRQGNGHGCRVGRWPASRYSR